MYRCSKYHISYLEIHFPKLHRCLRCYGNKAKNKDKNKI